MLKTAILSVILASLGCSSPGVANPPQTQDLPEQILTEKVVSPAPPSKKETPKTTLRDIELKYSRAKTFRAQVTKTLKLKILERESKLEGILELKKPKRFRLEFSKPEPSVVVTDGKTLWMVTPPADPDFDNTTRVIRTRNLEKIQTQALVTFLLGKGRLSSEFSIESETHEGGRARFLLKPKVRGDLEKVEILAQDATREILEIRYWDRLENETVLSLRDGKFNGPISNSQFVYSPPEGAEVEDL